MDIKRLTAFAALGAFAAWGDTGNVNPVAQFITDTAGYVYLTTDDTSANDTSFAARGRWSDNAAPSSGKDYLVQNNYVLRIGAGATFAGRSLTLDNGRIKGGIANQTATINDLRIYGGRIEATGNGVHRYAGNIRIRGTVDVPARFSMQSSRILEIASTLTGDADNVVKVMVTEQDASGMTSEFGECRFTADNSSTYRGRFRVEASTVGTSAYKHKIALVASSLSNLGAGDPAAGPVLTLKDRVALIAENGFMWNNPAYTLAIENDGTLVARNPAAGNPVGLTFSRGVSIAGVSPNATLRTCGATPIELNDVNLSNIGRIVTEEGNRLRLGSGYSQDDVPISLATLTMLHSFGATCGVVTAEGGTVIEMEGGLTAGGVTANGSITLRLGIDRDAGGALTADALVSRAKLVKAQAGTGVVIQLTRFPSGTDWTGRVRLLTASNLGEADGFGADDFSISGFPAAWIAARTTGIFEIVNDADGRHLEWVANMTSAQEVRIMPLGDSITYGSQSSLAGYRETLYQRLVGVGYRPNFIGSLQTSEGSPVTDPDHEGRRGWVISRVGNPDRSGPGTNAAGYDGLYENVESWFAQLGEGELPHIILLHIGTNDLLGDDFAHAKDRLGLLIDRLYDLAPSAWVVVSTLLDRTDSAAYNEQIATQFNPFVAEIAASRRRIGRRVAFVDLNDVVAHDELADGVHPNDAGYAKIAEAWFGAIRAIMPGTQVPPAAERSEIVTLTGQNPGGETSWNTYLQWDSQRAPDAGNFYFVPTNRTLRTPPAGGTIPFAGEALILNGGNVNLKGYDGCVLPANWVVYNSRIAHGCAHGASQADRIFVQTVAGTVDVRGTAEAPSVFSGSGSGSTRKTVVSADVRGGADAMIRVTRTAGETEETATRAFICDFAGDNTNYKGRFTADRGGNMGGGAYTIAFRSQAALGAPVADGAKVTLRENFTMEGYSLAMTNGYSVAVDGNAYFNSLGGRDFSGYGYGNEGIYFGKGAAITGSGESEITILDGGSRICFDDVTITGVSKIVVPAKSSVRLYKGYDNPQLPIEVYDLLAAGSPNAGPVTLKRGAAVQPGVGIDGPNALGSFGFASLTMEAGTELRLSVVNDGDSFTNDFIRVTGDLVKQDEKIKIVFDRFPHNLAVGTAVPLLSAANLGAGLTADDFEYYVRDAFLDQVIKGAFEVRDVEGVNTLFFVKTSKPVVSLVGSDAGGNISWQRGVNWENGLPPSSEYEYLVPSGTLLRHSVASDNDSFAGKSLSVTAGGDFAVCGRTAYVEDLRLFSDGYISTRVNGNANRLRGNATVYAARGNPFSFTIESGGATRTLNLEANLKGDGDVRFRYYPTSNGSGAVSTYYLVTGDNGGFRGGVELFQPAVCVDFRDESAMGGPAAEFRADRLRFTSNACLRCSSSYVMSDPTRGIMIGDGVAPMDGGKIEVLEGQTLTISNLISGTTSLRKKGAGTLALCCDTNEFSGVVRSQGTGGAIVIGAAGAVAKARLQNCEDVCVWRVDAPEGMTVNGVDAIIEDDSRRVRYLPITAGAFLNTRGKGRIEANLVRFKGATAADAELALSRLRLDATALGKSWTTELVTEEVEGALLVKVIARPRGFSIYIR